MSEPGGFATYGLARWRDYGKAVLRVAGGDLRRSIAFWFGAGVIAVIGFVLHAAGVISIAGVGWFFATGLGVLAALVFVGGYRLWDRAEGAYQKLAGDAPHLVFTGTESDWANVGTTSWRPLTSGMPTQSASVAAMAAAGRYRFVRVFVANDPGDRLGARARRVVAKIAFVDAEERELKLMNGRWAETEQRVESGRLNPSEDEAVIDIDANGRAHSLDIAMKVPGESEFYACNYENSGAPGLRLASHRLEESQCRVHVTVRAENALPITQTFVLSNPQDVEGFRLAASP